MKRWPVIVLSAVVVVVAAGGGWYWLRPHDPLAQANQFLAAGNVRGAQLALRSAVLNDPANARAHYMLADVELRAGDPVAAEREGRAAEQRGYDHAATTPLLAAATLAQRRFADVLRDYQPSDAMTPAQASSVLVQRGLAQFGLNHPDEAASSIAAAQQRDPHSFEAAMAAARLAQARRDIPVARKQVETALTIRPDEPEALLLQANLLILAGDRDAALKTYDTAIGHAGNNIGLRLARADLLSMMGDAARARTDVDAALKLQPKNPFANFLLARLLVQDKQWQPADAALTNALPILDRVPRGEFYLALVKANVQQPQQALDAAEHYFQRVPNDLAGARLVADLNLQAKRPARAVAVLEPLAKAGHADVPTLQLLAAAYQQAGNGRQAVDSLEQAQKLAPANTGVLTQLASARLSTGNASGATNDLQQALNLDSATPAAGTPTTGTSTTGTSATGTGISATPVDKTVDQPASRPAGPTPAQTAVALVQAAIRAGEPDRAAAALDRLRQMKNVDPVQLNLLSGMVSLAKLDIAGAKTAFQDAVKSRPDDITAQVELARVTAMQGDLPAAEKMLTGLADKNPGNPLVATSLEGVLLGQGKTDEAIRRLAAAHAAAPTDAALTVALAQLYARANNPQQALTVLGSVSGTPAPALLELKAQLQVQAGQTKDAADTLHQLLGQQPNNPAVARQLAQVLLASGDADGARATINSALSANPGNPLLLDSAVAIAARQGVPAALTLADQLARDPANRPASLAVKGDFLMSQRSYPEAIAAYQDASKTAPSDALTIRTALAQQAAGHADAGADLLRSWLGSHPDAIDVAETLSNFDLVANRLPQARETLGKVLAARPNDAAALNNLAWIEQHSGNLPHARQLAQRAYLLQASPQTADTLGWIVFQQGDAATAVPLLRQAAGGQDDPTIQYHLAAALQKTGQSQSAITILKNLAARPGTFSDKADADKLLQTLTHS